MTSRGASGDTFSSRLSLVAVRWEKGGAYKAVAEPAGENGRLDGATGRSPPPWMEWESPATTAGTGVPEVSIVLDQERPRDAPW